MNFEKNTDFETQLSNLLAFIIMFQKKIEFIKCRLAGNEQFHTRLVFQKLDIRKRNEIGTDQIANALHVINGQFTESDCSLFLRRYSANGNLSYEEFLKLLTPKTNKILAQRMMIRNLLKGAHLQDYLFNLVLQLLHLYVKMSSITEQLRRKILKNSQLSHLDIIQFLRHFRSPQSILYFINKSNNDEEYDLEPHDVLFLSKHIRSNNEISEFTDTDIKELICPIDMNCQKPVAKTSSNYMYQLEEQPHQYATKTVNFLNKTYQKTGFINQNRHAPFQQSVQPTTRLQPYNRKEGNQNVNVDASYNGLYIDNFSKNNGGGIQLDHFFNKKRKGYEKFDDDLSNASSLSKRSYGTAFVQY